jgi:hypothetical protein
MSQNQVTGSLGQLSSRDRCRKWLHLTKAPNCIWQKVIAKRTQKPFIDARPTQTRLLLKPLAP